MTAALCGSRLPQCSGTCVLYKIPVLIMAENDNFVGGEDLLASKGVEIVNLRDAEITKMMRDWIASDVGRRVWNEDIGEVSA
jgi:cytosine deaminase